MFFGTSIIAENDLEYLVSLYTHAVYLSQQDQVRLTQQSYTVTQFLSIIRKLQNDRFDLRKSHQLSNKYSYTHNAGLMQPTRAKFNLRLGNTVIPLSRANYPTNYGFIHTMNPTQPTARLN